VLPRLVGDPGLATADLASHIVHAYVQSYVDMGYSGDVTQAALDLAQIGALNTALDHLADALRARLPRASSQIWKAHAKSKRFWHNTLADIGSFSSQMKKATRTEPIKVAATEVTAALQPGAGKFVIAEAHNGSGVTASSGVTVYLPSPLVGISQYYGDLKFASQHKWMPMLKAYVET
jgi:hypothetical protein